jgi:hypothetical protein
LTSTSYVFCFVHLCFLFFLFFCCRETLWPCSMLSLPCSCSRCFSLCFCFQQFLSCFCFKALCHALVMGAPCCAFILSICHNVLVLGLFVVLLFKTIVYMRWSYCSTFQGKFTFFPIQSTFFPFFFALCVCVWRCCFVVNVCGYVVFLQDHFLLANLKIFCL